MKENSDNRRLLLCILVCFIVLINNLPVTAKGSDFYTRLFKTGKKLYFEGNYNEAEENFRIAQFGLHDNPDLLKKTYLFYALSNFKLKRGEKVVEIVKKLLELYNVDRAEKIEKPDDIKADLDSMFSAIYSDYIPADEESITGGNVVKKSQKKKLPENRLKYFNRKFFEVKKALDSNDLKKTELGIKNLRKIKKKDPRINFLNGILLFRKGKYSSAANHLLKARRGGIENINDDINYYLSLNYYFLKNYGQTLAFYQRIKKNSLRKKLTDIINKTREIRKTLIKKNVNDLFNKKLFSNTVKQFEGDHFIPKDTFLLAISRSEIGDSQLKKYVKYCMKKKNIYEINFILISSDYFFKKKDYKFAIKILKSSKYFDPPKKQNIEIFYKLGTYYYQMKSKKSAIFMFKVVNKLSPGYKNSFNYIDKLKKLH